MATYVLTLGDNAFDGTSGADTFDGYEFDDGLGATGGVDTLRGLGGNDRFLLNAYTQTVGGLIDGGDDTDTVFTYASLHDLSFQNVEILSVEGFEISASISQLNAFSTITTSFATMPRIQFYLQGTGGIIDLSSRLAPGKSIDLNAISLSSGYQATGTGLDDYFTNSRYDDIVHGGGGGDSFFARNNTFRHEPNRGGNDMLYGEGGNDSFFVCSQSGTFDGGSGTDTVYAFPFNGQFGNFFGNLDGATFVDVERLITGTVLVYASIDQLNDFQTITGGNADKRIWFDQRAGAGGTIDFSTKVTLAGEHVTFRAYGATSAVTVTGTLGDDTLVGSDFGDQLNGGGGDDYLGGADFSAPDSRRDTLRGASGDDTYYLDGLDLAIETATGPAGGSDTVISTVSFDLAYSPRLQGEFENLTLGGILGAENPHTNGYGNALDNVLTGNDGNNRLDGRAGADRMVGKDGNDTYVVDDAGDRIVERELIDAGTDTVLSFRSFDLGDAARVVGLVEHLTLLGGADLNATGNALANQLTGTAGANTLDGKGGADTLSGLGGNDTYVVDSAGDQVLEAAGGGTADRVNASASYMLAAGQQVEILGTTNVAGTGAINLTGNAFVQTVYGNAGANFLNGHGGSDTLSGFGGSDTFSFTTGLGAGNVDHITDFSAPADTIRLAKTIFSVLSVGTLDASAYKDIGDPGAVVDDNDRILYDDDTGALYYDSNGSGAGGRTLFAVLDNTPATLTSADFVVVG